MEFLVCPVHSRLNPTTGRAGEKSPREPYRMITDEKKVSHLTLSQVGIAGVRASFLVHKGYFIAFGISDFCDS